LFSSQVLVLESSQMCNQAAASLFISDVYPLVQHANLKVTNGCWMLIAKHAHFLGNRPPLESICCLFNILN